MEKLKVDVVDTKQCMVTLKVEVPHPEVVSETKKVYQQIQQSARIPGFRQGKAPMEMIKKNFVENARGQVVQNLAEKAVFTALKEKGIEPVDYPKIDEVSFDFDKPFKFKVLAEKHPEFKVKDYKGIKIVKDIHPVTEQKVNENIETLREKNAKLVESKSETVNEKHYVMVDYEAFKGDKPVAELKTQNQLMDLSSAQLLAGFKEGLVGAKKGDEKEIKVKFPAEHPNKELANQDIVFKVKVNEIKEKELHPLDDEFAKDFGLKSLAELKDKIKENLETEENKRQDHEVREQIIEHLVKANNFQVPNVFVQAQLKSTMERMEHYFKHQGLPESYWKENLEKNKDKHNKEAEDKVKLSYILRDIGKIEKIEVTDEDLKQELDNLKKTNPGRDAEVEKYFNESKDNLAAGLKEDKIFKFIIENAKIKEKIIK